MIFLFTLHQSVARQKKENAYSKETSLETEQFIDYTFREVIRTYILRIMVQSNGQGREKFD